MNAAKRKSNLEQKLYLVYHQDGILDIVTGCALLIFAAVAYFEAGAFIGLTGIPLAMYIPIKQQVSVPRLGFIRFESAREQGQKLGLTLLLGIAAFVGLVAIYLLNLDLPENLSSLIFDNIRLVFGAALGTVLAGAAYFLNNRRFYFYAGAGVALSWGARFFSYPLGIGLGILAAAVLGIGIVLLARFIRTTPAQENGAHE